MASLSIISCYENAFDHLNKLIYHNLLPQMLHDLAVVWKCWDKSLNRKVHFWCVIFENVEIKSHKWKVHFWCVFSITYFHTFLISLDSSLSISFFAVVASTYIFHILQKIRLVVLHSSSSPRICSLNKLLWTVWNFTPFTLKRLVILVKWITLRFMFLFSCLSHFPNLCWSTIFSFCSKLTNFLTPFTLNNIVNQISHSLFECVPF